MTTFSRKMAAALIAACLVAAAAQPDTLYLRDGEQQLGRLREITEDNVVFENREGSVKTLPKNLVNQIQLQRARMHDDIETVDQITDPDLKAAIESQPSELDFPADGFVTLLDRRTIDMREKDVIKDTRRTLTKILRQRGEAAGSQLVWYFEDTDVPEIDFALTVTADGRVLHLSDSAVKNESVYATLPDYRRLARYRFAAKEPAPGCILDIQHTVLRNRETKLEPFYAQEVFRQDAPLLKKELVVLLDPSRENELNTQLREVKSGPVLKSREISDGAVRLTFSLAQPQPGVLAEPNMPPRPYYATVVTLADAATWQDIATEYAEALETVPQMSQDLEDRAQSLAKMGGPRAIHNFVARSIRSLPVPHAHYKIVPQAPDDTARRGMANELDKNFLYYKMLEAAGVPASFALVRARSAGPLGEQTPSIKAFDRSAVFLETDKMFSSAANDMIPFETLPAALQTSPALVINKNPVLTATQLSPPDLEKVATSFDSKLRADGTLDIVFQFKAKGNTGAWMRGMQRLDRQQLANQLQQIASSLHHTARLNDFAITDLADLAITPSITLDMTIPAFAVHAGDLLLMNLPGVNHDAGDVGRPSREFDMFWNQVLTETTTGTIELPEGIEPYALPQPVNFDSETAAYTAEIKPNGHTIEFNEKYQLKVPRAPKDAYTDYKKCHEIRANLTRQRIILKTQ